MHGQRKASALFAISFYVGGNDMLCVLVLLNDEKILNHENESLSCMQMPRTSDGLDVKLPVGQQCVDGVLGDPPGAH